MTDNEIIKALECCANNICSECPCRKMFCSENIAIAYALDLINRQKAEIERLEDVVYRLTLHNNSLCLLDETQKKAIKSEAIKEFAERLKNKLTACSRTIDGVSEYLILDVDIDNLVKEMTEKGGADYEQSKSN